jgi:hypothetical protein
MSGNQEQPLSGDANGNGSSTEPEIIKLTDIQVNISVQCEEK